MFIEIITSVTDCLIAVRTQLVGRNTYVWNHTVHVEHRALYSLKRA